jgi:hypothetical protein
MAARRRDTGFPLAWKALYLQATLLAEQLRRLGSLTTPPLCFSSDYYPDIYREPLIFTAYSVYAL